jgi:hypothetical protein
MLTLMTREWLSLLERVGWEAPEEELSWCTTADDDINLKVIVNGKLVGRPKRGAGFKALGTMVAFDNNVDVEVGSRELLGCASAPLAKRVQIFRATVEATFLWCAGSWNLRADQLKRIKGAQEEGEEMDELIIRSNRILKQRLHDSDIKHAWWDEKYVQLRLDWGGHVARLRKLDPSRLTSLT